MRAYKPDPFSLIMNPYFLALVLNELTDKDLPLFSEYYLAASSAVNRLSALDFANSFS